MPEALEAIQSTREFERVVSELAKRKTEALRLYRPREAQTPFHASATHCRILRGGNRAGKTLAAAIEFASAATGIPLLDHNDQPIPFKYNWSGPLTLWMIGWSPCAGMTVCLRPSSTSFCSVSLSVPVRNHQRCGSAWKRRA